MSKKRKAKKRVSYCQTLIEILVLGYEKWWSLPQIVMAYLGVDEEQYLRMPKSACSSMCRRIKSNTGNIRLMLDGLGELLLTMKDKSGRIVALKVATADEEDAPFVRNEIQRNVDSTKRRGELHDARVVVVRAKKLLSSTQTKLFKL